MCRICDRDGLVGRRALLGLGLAGMAAAFVPGRARAGIGGVATTLTADEALEKLKSGNARYLDQPDLCLRDVSAGRAAVAESQAPWATIVSCADSRVLPQILFGGVGLGDLFVARNAGNTVNEVTMGTVEYGAAVLGVPLVVVLGHERCGAVVAACDAVANGTKFPGAIGAVVRPIIPSAKAVAKLPGDFVDNTVRENARRMARKIARRSSIISGLVKTGKVKVVAARYDLDRGQVQFLS